VGEFINKLDVYQQTKKLKQLEKEHETVCQQAAMRKFDLEENEAKFKSLRIDI
jgi:hypothetical protein